MGLVGANGALQTLTDSWGGGVPCAHQLAIDYAVLSHPQVVGLMTSVNQSANRVAMHAVRCVLLQEQADAAGLPLYQVGGRAHRAHGRTQPLVVRGALARMRR